MYLHVVLNLKQIEVVAASQSTERPTPVEASTEANP
jgi:hypothetical protein